VFWLLRSYPGDRARVHQHARDARVSPRLVSNRPSPQKQTRRFIAWCALASLFRLVYVSTARPGLTDSDIEDLLNVAQSNNDERYITGYLVHNGPSFMQLIEGPKAEVDEIYGRIVADDRHSGVIRILAEWASERAFPNWSMNYFRVDQHGSVGMMISRQQDSVDSLMDAGVPRDVLRLFSKFIQQTEHQDPHTDHTAPSGSSRSDPQQDPRG
jgi:hypothetical protein